MGGEKKKEKKSEDYAFGPADLKRNQLIHRGHNNIGRSLEEESVSQLLLKHEGTLSMQKNKKKR